MTLTVEADRANLEIARHIWWLLGETSLEGFLSVNHMIEFSMSKHF